VVLFRENHILGAGESGEVGNPGALGMTKGKGSGSIENGCWTEAFFSFGE
jgi:hypothetical protein